MNFSLDRPLILKLPLRYTTHKSPVSILFQLHYFKQVGRVLHSEIPEIKVCVLNKEDLLQQWKEPVYIIYEMEDKPNYSNFLAIFMLSALYKFYRIGM
jgi:hypothetical protein